MAVTVRSGRPVARAASANGADVVLKHGKESDVYLTTVTIDLNDVDVLKLYYE